MNPLKRDKEEELLGKLPPGGQEEGSFYLGCKSIRERFCKQWEDAATQHVLIKMQLHLMEDVLKITHPLDQLTKEQRELYADLQRAEARFRTNKAHPNNGVDPVTNVPCQKELNTSYTKVASRFEVLAEQWRTLEPLLSDKLTKYTELKKAFNNFEYTEAAADQFCLDGTRTKDNIKVAQCLFHARLIKQIETQEALLQTSQAAFKKLPLENIMHYLDWLEPAAAGREADLVWWSRYKSFRAWRGPNAIKFLAGKEPPKLELLPEEERKPPEEVEQFIGQQPDQQPM
jgi:hypothetical protein